MAGLSKNDCIALLREKSAELKAAGESRFPSRSDFTADEVAAVKAHLGPWPRALEAAGLKEANPEREEKKKEKRINQKRKITQAKIEKRNSQ